MTEEEAPEHSAEASLSVALDKNGRVPDYLQVPQYLIAACKVTPSPRTTCNCKTGVVCGNPHALAPSDLFAHGNSHAFDHFHYPSISLLFPKYFRYRSICFGSPPSLTAMGTSSTPVSLRNRLAKQKVTLTSSQLKVGVDV